MFVCSAADIPVNPTGLESAVSPWSRHSMLVSAERVVKPSVVLELELGCATQVLSVAAVTVTCTWLDADSCGFHIVSSGDHGFLQLIGVIAAIVVVSTLDASATWAVPVMKGIWISQYYYI